MDWVCARCGARAPTLKGATSCQVCGHKGFSLGGRSMKVRVNPAVGKDKILIQGPGGGYVDLRMYDKPPEPRTRADEGWDSGALANLIYCVLDRDRECRCHDDPENPQECEECVRESCSICRYWRRPVETNPAPIYPHSCNYMHLPGRMCVKCGQVTY